MYQNHTMFMVTDGGNIERREGQLPAVIRLPAVSVKLAPGTDSRTASRLLRLLADELEGATL